MTAVADSGQLYWTFEDLDFTGAIDQLHQELNDLRIVYKFLFDRHDEVIKSDFWKKEMSKITARRSLLIQVGHYLLRLNAGGVFNG